MRTGPRSEMGSLLVIQSAVQEIALAGYRTSVLTPGQSSLPLDCH
jgi:hypothetical protein